MIEIKNPNKLLELLNGIKNVGDTVVFYYQEKGIYLQGQDCAHISFIELELKETMFSIIDEFEPFCIPIILLVDVLKLLKDSESLTFELKEDSVLITNENDNFFEVNLMQVCEERIAYEPPEFKYSYTLDRKNWELNCKKILKFSPNVSLDFGDGYVMLNFKNENLSGRLRTNAEMEEEYTDFYSVGISLKHICNVFFSTQSVKISTHPEYPITICFEDPDYLLQYTIAPKIDNN